mgnify:CR=1 FL=1
MYLKSGALEMFCAGGGERGGQATDWFPGFMADVLPGRALPKEMVVCLVRIHLTGDDNGRCGQT